MERVRVSRNLSERRHISATSRSVLQDRYGQGGPRRDTRSHEGRTSFEPHDVPGGMTMKRKNLVLAAVIALVGSALAGTALAQASPSGMFGSAFSNAQQNGRGGDFGRSHEGNRWGQERGRFRA